MSSVLGYIFIVVQVQLLSMLCRDKCKEKYVGSVELLLSASKQIREEVAAMEVDILVGQNVAGLLEKSRPQMEKVTKELLQAAIIASGNRYPLWCWCCCMLCCCMPLHIVALCVDAGLLHVVACCYMLLHAVTCCCTLC